jgi:hypothetical protein
MRLISNVKVKKEDKMLCGAVCAFELVSFSYVAVRESRTAMYVVYCIVQSDIEQDMMPRGRRRGLNPAGTLGELSETNMSDDGWTTDGRAMTQPHDRIRNQAPTVGLDCRISYLWYESI